MIDWDDVRYFLAAARGGSVRAAAKSLGVNHATVLRRIAQLEERLGAQMFERLPSGYRLTAAGEEVLEFANQMEASSHQLETRVFGRDQSVRGLLRVTLPPFHGTHLLMPDIAEFARLHPDIEMELVSTGEVANLTNRDADVAIRMVTDRKTLPLNLHALKGPNPTRGYLYVARKTGCVACGCVRSGPANRYQQSSSPGLGRRRAGSRYRHPVPDAGCGSADRCGKARDRHDHTALFRRRCGTAADESSGHRSEITCDDLASHAWGDTQDEARAAVHGIRISRLRHVRSAPRRAVDFARLTSHNARHNEQGSLLVEIGFRKGTGCRVAALLEIETR